MYSVQFLIVFCLVIVYVHAFKYSLRRNVIVRTNKNKCFDQAKFNKGLVNRKFDRIFYLKDSEDSTENLKGSNPFEAIASAGLAGVLAIGM